MDMDMDDDGSHDEISDGELQVAVGRGVKERSRYAATLFGRLSWK
jgi:hypothetical protein